MENKPKNAFMPKLKNFLKKYGYYLLLLLCVGMLITVITLSVANSNLQETNAKPNPSTPVTPSPGPSSKPVGITWGNPLADAVVSQVYSATPIAVSEGQYRSHYATDYTAEVGTDVLAAADGIVDDVKFGQYTDGGVIVIKHEDGWKTIYKQLDNTTTLKKGDSVTMGQVIGKVGSGYGAEKGFGAHLHFEMMQNDSYINAETIIPGTEK